MKEQSSSRGRKEWRGLKEKLSVKAGRMGHDGTGWPRLCTGRARAVNNGGNKSARGLAALFRDKRRREWEQRPSTSRQ